MKYDVVLNWYGELHTFLIDDACNENHAKKQAIKELALKLKVTRYSVRQHVYFGNKITCYPVYTLK